MKQIYIAVQSTLLLVLVGLVLWSCEAWDLPGKKMQRSCAKPSGNLDAGVQQRQVSFSVSNASGTIDQVEWDFGDGSTTITTGLTAAHTYTESKVYTVKATLTNACKDGYETTLIRAVTVSDALLAAVNLQDPTSVSLTSATFPLTITFDGNTEITQYGICYSATNPVPEVNKDASVIGTLPPTVATIIPLSLTSLTPNTPYYARAFVTNKAGTDYSTPIRFFRTNASPVVSTNINLTSTGITTANVSFILVSPGNPAAVEYGICYSATSNAPDVTNSPTAQVANPVQGANTIINLTNLTAQTQYFYRTYAKLSDNQVIYGPNVNSFTTQINTIAQDLVAAVSFTDQSLLDASGNGNNAILVNNPTFTTDHKGRLNSAILLDGQSNYFYMADNSTLNPKSLSISLWIKPTQVNRWMQIYNKSRFSDGTAEMYSSLIKPGTFGGGGITINTDIKQNSNCQKSIGWQTFFLNANPPVGEWYHIVMTYSGRSARMYYNGELVSAFNNLPADQIDQCPGGDLKFGVQDKTLPNYFYGAIDDIRIYKRALTDDEVKTLRNQ